MPEPFLCGPAEDYWLDTSRPRVHTRPPSETAHLGGRCDYERNALMRNSTVSTFLHVADRFAASGVEEVALFPFACPEGTYGGSLQPAEQGLPLCSDQCAAGYYCGMANVGAATSGGATASIWAKTRHFASSVSGTFSCTN